MLAGASSTTRMRPCRGAKRVLASVCIAVSSLLELTLGVGEGKARDVPLELGERPRREPRPEQLPVGSQVIHGGDVVVGQVLPHLLQRVLGGAGHGCRGSRLERLATIGN